MYAATDVAIQGAVRRCRMPRRRSAASQTADPAKLQQASGDSYRHAVPSQPARLHPRSRGGASHVVGWDALAGPGDRRSDSLTNRTEVAIWTCLPREFIRLVPALEVIGARCG